MRTLVIIVLLGIGLAAMESLLGIPPMPTWKSIAWKVTVGLWGIAIWNLL